MFFFFFAASAAIGSAVANPAAAELRMKSLLFIRMHFIENPSAKLAKKKLLCKRNCVKNRSLACSSSKNVFSVVFLPRVAFEKSTC